MIPSLFAAFLATALAQVPAEAPDIAAEISAPLDAVVPDEAVEAEPEDAGYPIRFEGQVTEETAGHWDLEVAYTERRYREGLEKARAYLAADPTDAEAAWHIVRFMFEIGELDDSIDKLSWYKSMVKVVDDAVDHHPDDRHLRFARGVANGRYGTTRGVLASLFLARTIERDWKMAADGTFVYASIGGTEQLPCDAWHALGIFYRLVPDWWIVKVLAGTRGDLDESLRYHKKSNTTCPNRKAAMKEMAVTELCIADKRDDPAMKEQGLRHLREGRAAPTPNPKAEIDNKHIDMLLGDPSLACEYSRDGQQDLDKKKLDN